MNNNGTLPTELRRTLQISTVTFEYILGALGEYVDAGLLVAMGHFAHQIGLPAAFRTFVDIKQKHLRHDPIDKLLTGFVSLADGCGYTSDIDTALKPYPALAQAWTLPAFAGQNVVNDTLHLVITLLLYNGQRASDGVEQIERISHRSAYPIGALPGS